MLRYLFAAGTPPLVIAEAPEGPTHGAGLKFGPGPSAPRLSRDEVAELRDELVRWLER